MLLERVPNLVNTVTKIVLDEQLNGMRDSGVFEFGAKYRYVGDPLAHEADSDFESYEEKKDVSTARAATPSCSTSVRSPLWSLS